MFKTLRKVKNYVTENPERVITIISVGATGVLLYDYKPWKYNAFLVEKKLMTRIADRELGVLFVTKKHGDLLMMAAKKSIAAE